MSTCRLLLSAVLVALLASWSAAALTPDPGASDTADPEAYDVEFGLTRPGPQAAVLLDWQADSGLALRCEARGTTLATVQAGRETVLGKGTAAVAGAVRVQRRFPLVRVIQAGKVLLETCSRRPLGGAVAAAKGSGLSDLRVQPVAPVEFRDEFFDPSGGESQWEAARGNWQMVQYRDPLVATQDGPIGAAWYEAREGQDAVAVTGHEFWDDLRLRVAVKAAPGCAVGLVFGYQDKDNYQAIVLQPKPGDREAELSLRVVQGGKPQTTHPFTRFVKWQANAWQELTLRVGGGTLECFINDLEMQGPPGCAAPQATVGKVGLFASGPGVSQFDDFMVTPATVVQDSFTRGQLGEGWAAGSPAWSVSKGRLAYAGKSHSQCQWAGTVPTDVSASVTVRGKPGLSGIALIGEGRTYLCGVGPKRTQIVRVTPSGRQVVREGEQIGEADYWLGVEFSQGAVVLYDHSGPLDSVRDLSFRPRRVALFSTGPAGFDDFHLEALSPEPAAVISALSGKPETWPGENEGTSRPVLGFLWRPQGGYWRAQPLGDDMVGLRAAPYGTAPAALWYYVPCPGQAQMTAVRPQVPGSGTLGLTVACTGEDLKTGYAAELTGGPQGSLRLLRQGKLLVAASCPKPGAELRLWVEGGGLDAECDVIATCGTGSVVYTDKQPLSGDRCGAYATGKDVTLAELRLSNRWAEYYAFRSPETDWVPLSGEWNTHSGMACIAWDYWLSAFGQPQAWLLTRRQLGSRGVHVDFWLSEYTEGYANKEHKHFPYHDVSLALGVSGDEPERGYRFVIGAEKGTATRLLRGTQVVAETRDPRFRIAMGGHCSSPRAIHVVADVEGKKLTLDLNGQRALEYTAPEAVGRGQVGLGVEGCHVNFRDLWIAER